MFGEVAAIDGALRTASATALMHSKLCVIPARSFLAAACSTPDASLELLRHVTTILRRQSKRLLERERVSARAVEECVDCLHEQLHSEGMGAAIA